MKTYTVGMMYQYQSRFYSTSWIEAELRQACAQAERELSQTHPSIEIRARTLASTIGEDPRKTTVKDIVSDLLKTLDLVIFEFSEPNPNVMIEFGIRLETGRHYLVIKNEASTLPLPTNVGNEFYLPYAADDELFHSTLAQKIKKVIDYELLRSDLREATPLPGAARPTHNGYIKKEWEVRGRLFDIYVDYRATAEMRKEFVHEITRRHISEKFRYIGLDETMAWLRLCDDQDYRTYWDSVDLLRNSMASTLEDVARCGDKELDFVCLGVGSGVKEKLILTRLLERQKDIDLVLVDASIEMICLSVIYYTTQLAGDLGRVHGCGILGDLMEHLPPARRTHHERPALFALLGNTIGNYKEETLLDAVGEMMEPGDYIIIDSQVLPENVPDKKIIKEIERSYKNPLFKKFVMTPLYRAAGFRDDSGFVDLHIKRSHPDRSVRAFTVRYSWKFNTSCEVADTSFRKESRIELGFSIKYDFEVLCEIVKTAGFKIRGRYVHDNGFHGMLLAQKA